MRSFFNPDNFLWRFISKATDFVALSLLWTFLSLPVITAGPASAALYYTVIRVYREGEMNTFQLFFRSLKENFRQSLLLWLILLPLFLMMGFGEFVMLAYGGSRSGQFMLAAYSAALLVPLGIFCWVLPLCVRFRLKKREIFRNALLLTAGHLPTALAAGLLTLALGVLTALYWVPVFFAPALAAWLQSLLYERVFVKYLSVEDRARLHHRSVEEEEMKSK